MQTKTAANQAAGGQTSRRPVQQNPFINTNASICRAASEIIRVWGQCENDISDICVHRRLISCISCQ